jgi:hypothetical protein
MSFPYRVIALFVHSKIGQVILLRLINVAIFAYGIMLLRRVLLRVKLSPQLVNVSLFLFVLIPVVPQLAGQINYDNTIIPLVAAACLLAFDAIDQIRNKRPSTRTLLMLFILSVFGCLVKYEFMPVSAAIFLFLLYSAHHSFRGNIGALFTKLKADWHDQSRWMQVILVSLVVISTGMLVQRDGVNLVKYHTFSPNCSSVLSVNACKAYTVWDHDYKSHKLVVEKVNKVNSNPLYYVSEWIYWLWYRLFFAINGPSSNYKNYPPLPLPSAAFIVIGLTGLAAAIKWRRRIFRNNPYIMLFGIIAIFYLVALFAEGYLTYEYTDVLELMNGRYLLPILPLAAAIIGSALSIALRKSPRLKVVIAIGAIMLFLQGGGVLTFIARSDSSWDFNNPTVVKVNNVARHITNPILLNGKSHYSTPLWFFN